jgi:hypothetical protein
VASDREANRCDPPPSTSTINPSHSEAHLTHPLGIGTVAGPARATGRGWRLGVARLARPAVAKPSSGATRHACPRSVVGGGQAAGPVPSPRRGQVGLSARPQPPQGPREARPPLSADEAVFDLRWGTTSHALGVRVALGRAHFRAACPHLCAVDTEIMKPEQSDKEPLTRQEPRTPGRESAVLGQTNGSGALVRRRP